MPVVLDNSSRNGISGSFNRVTVSVFFYLRAAKHTFSAKVNMIMSYLVVSRQNQ